MASGLGRRLGEALLDGQGRRRPAAGRRRGRGQPRARPGRRPSTSLELVAERSGQPVEDEPERLQLLDGGSNPSPRTSRSGGRRGRKGDLLAVRPGMDPLPLRPEAGYERRAGQLGDRPIRRRPNRAAGRGCRVGGERARRQRREEGRLAPGLHDAGRPGAWRRRRRRSPRTGSRRSRAGAGRAGSDRARRRSARRSPARVPRAGRARRPGPPAGRTPVGRVGGAGDPGLKAANASRAPSTVAASAPDPDRGTSPQGRAGGRSRAASPAGRRAPAPPGSRRGRSRPSRAGRPGRAGRSGRSRSRGRRPRDRRDGAGDVASGGGGVARSSVHGWRAVGASVRSGLRGARQASRPPPSA